MSHQGSLPDLRARRDCNFAGAGEHEFQQAISKVHASCIELAALLQSNAGDSNNARHNFGCGVIERVQKGRPQGLREVDRCGLAFEE